MFKKILIANRGEIACRVIKSAKRMGIATVAVYSEADRDALHVEMADEGVEIGPAPAAESYLVIEKIIDACKATGAEAVHPGYGFLSENAAFATALSDAGIAFIGPPVKAIEAMGDKIESKKFADAAGVSTVPGHIGVIKDAEEAVTIAEGIGYPVMLKASAGGGGKGMRIAWNADEAREGFERATSEAASSFGDDRVFVEKFVVDPRHIEIQVLADKNGNVIHLNERECSIQRRNQKVIEEAPSPFLTPETRAAMGEQAVALSKAVGYESAGTVEFIVDKDRNFYFLEMNTRLQVEHPVTELITGIDLVEQMIRVAANEPLVLSQDDIGIEGWAVESRVYAEDPYRNFLPSIGRLTTYRPPQDEVRGGVTVRNDTGVVEGSEISLYSDPMIAKLCTHAASRENAIDVMTDALDRFALDGIAHNIPFLSALMTHERWRDGRLTTGFIAEEYPDGFSGAPLTEEISTVLCAAAAQIHLFDEWRKGDGAGPDEVSILLDGERLDVTVVEDGEEGLVLSLGKGDAARDVRVVADWLPGSPVWQGYVNGEPIAIQVRRSDSGIDMTHRGVTVHARALPPHVTDLVPLMPVKVAPDTSNMLLCPMPGLLVSLAVEEGQEIAAGDTLCIVEAMKMENVLRAERDATVAKIKAGEGDSLAVDQVIMEFS
ncbi:MAG: acetyl/propionyl/methylcrotonyl-CoA carboxylase subunit alpha [Pseudomonadota bacterium]